MKHGVPDGDVLQNHRIPAHQLAELCAGGGSVAALRTLWAGQRSRRRLLLRVVQDALDASPGLGPLPPVDAAWSALVAAEAVAPEAVDAVLLDPQVGSWAAYVLRRVRGLVTSAEPLWADAGAFHTLALVASARADVPWHTTVPVRDGKVMLPTLGMACLGDGSAAQAAQATYARGVLRLRLGDRTVVVPEDPAREADGWWPLRRLRVGADQTLSVFLNDIDPFRELADPVAPERLDEDAVRRWSELLTGAWAMLCRDHAETARALAEGVVCIVPLPADELGTTRSASTGEAFASVMISPPVDEVDLAVSLVHEFQHVKLGGLLHLLPMTEHTGEAVHRAPWRDDPRPIIGLVQGVYAFFGIADFWRRRRFVSTGIHRRIADFEFAYSGRQVREALAELGASAELTEFGRRLVAGLAGRARAWPAESVDPMAASLAEVLCRWHRTEWRLRYRRPDPAQVRMLAAAWPAGTDAGLGPLRAAVVPESTTIRWSLAGQELARAHLVGYTDRTTAPPADVAFLSGDTERAGAAYRRAVAADPGDLHVWTGLSLTATEEPLHCRPEWVRAVFDILRADHQDLDPLAVSRWLSRAVPSLALPVLPEDPLDLAELG